MSSNKHRKRKAYRRRSNNRKRLLLSIVLVVVIISSIGVYFMLSGNEPVDPYQDSTKVLLTTNMGNILIELRNDMPITTENFKNLTQHGIYDNTIFHRVIAEFMIQGGDPTGTGIGDPSIPNIADEFTSNNHNNRGTISMANTGNPNTGSSQFFINVVDNNYLDSKHPVFGRVIEGMDVVDSISIVTVNNENFPIEDVTIIKAEIKNQ